MINGDYTVSINRGIPLTVTFKGMYLVDSWQYNGTLVYSSTDSGKTWKLDDWNLTNPDGGGMYDVTTFTLPKSLDPLLRKELAKIDTTPISEKEKFEIEESINTIEAEIKQKQLELQQLKYKRYQKGYFR